MQRLLLIPLFLVLTFSLGSFAQDGVNALPGAGSSQTGGSHFLESPDDAKKTAAEWGAPAANDSNLALSQQADGQTFGVRDKFGYYMIETYLNPSTLTAPAFRAGIRMATPPGKGPTRYPAEWRQGAEAFGRNYGDAFAERASFHTARFLTGAIIR